jgi:hypothetical protein
MLRLRAACTARTSFDGIRSRLSPLQFELMDIARTGLVPGEAKAAAARHGRGKAHAQVASRALRNLVNRGLLECVGRAKSKSGHRYKLSLGGAHFMRWGVNNKAFLEKSTDDGSRQHDDSTEDKISLAI